MPLVIVFYVTVNVINDLVRLQLVKSFCLPLITYCLGAIEFPRYKVKEIGVCWNDAFRKIFGYNRWESVKELQWHLGELPFEFIYDIYRWKFLNNRSLSDCACYWTLAICNMVICLSSFILMVTIL